MSVTRKLSRMNHFFRCISDLMAGQNFVPPDTILLQLIQRFQTAAVTDFKHMTANHGLNETLANVLCILFFFIYTFSKLLIILICFSIISGIWFDGNVSYVENTVFILKYINKCFLDNLLLQIIGHFDAQGKFFI